MATSKKSDYYELLGIDRSATSEEIKKAYRKQAVRYHPDHNPQDRDAEEKFKLIGEAYSILSDPTKRKQYDTFGHSAFQGGPSSSGYGQVDLGSIGEILEGFFGDIFSRKSDAHPHDLNYDLDISFEEAALGAVKSIEFERNNLCPICRGTRAEPNSPVDRCPACKGRGEIRFQRGFFSSSRPCSSCHGTGVRIHTLCTRCKGEGTIRGKVSLSVQIPAGVEDGAVRTIREEGEETISGKGNLHINVCIKDHPFFIRNGADIQCEVPVSFPQAALGAELQIPTIEGKVKMKLPMGTQSGRVFRLRGKGMPIFGGYGKGDQLVKIIVEIPENITQRQRELLEQLAVEMDSSSHPRQESFLNKLKSLFD